MRSIIVGDKAISQKCLQWLRDSGEDVSEIPNDERTREDADFAAWVKSLSPDVIFSIQAKRIFKKEVIGIPPLGIINLHYSLLPRNRGMYPVAWALINGDRMGGVTLHYIDEGIDTGDVIANSSREIPLDYTASDLYQMHEEMAFKLFMDFYPIIKSGGNSRIPQSTFGEPSYHDRHSIDFSKTKIEWWRRTEELYNWMRAFIFPSHPCPYFKFSGAKFEVLECRRYDRTYPYDDGIVAEISDKWLVVTTANGSIAISKMRVGDAPITPHNLIQTWGMKVGDVLE